MLRSSLLSSFLTLFVFGFGSVQAHEASGQLSHGPEHGSGFVIEMIDGQKVCRVAGSEDRPLLQRVDRSTLRVIYDRGGRGHVAANGIAPMTAGARIILRSTAQLDASPVAKAAFIKAAQTWEAIIADPITVYIDVDYGPTRFGTPYPRPTILGSASTDDRGFNPGNYEFFRQKLLANADNATESAAYSSLPTGALPTDLGSTNYAAAASIQLRAIGVIEAVAPADDEAPNIGFNSQFPFDFDPSNGIDANKFDFIGTAVHEIGHTLGFGSYVGLRDVAADAPPLPSIFDFFRFRPGVNMGTFRTAQRPLSSGGEQVYFAGLPALAMSTGNPDGKNGDENQASHWKADELTGLFIGIMDPTGNPGEVDRLTANDLAAFGMLGYKIVSGSTPVTPVPSVPGNLTATLQSATVALLKWSDATGETSYVVERKVNNGEYAQLGNIEANATSATVSPLQQGVTYTFRIKARNAAGDSAYSNEASVNTGGGSTGPCAASANVVCLLSNRFRISIDYINAFANPPQPGKFVGAKLLAGAQNPDVATFGISGPQAIEVVVRIQDARPFGINRFDIYYGGLTDLEYTVAVTDTQTGTTRTYRNAPGTVGGGVDRSSFTGARLPDDQLFTTGGADSFPAGEEKLHVRPIRSGEMLERQASTRTSLTKAEARLLYEDARSAGAAWTVVESQQQPGMTSNSGGGGACSESEPNETIANASALTLGTPCTGNASIADISNYEVDDDPIEDVFKFTLSSPGKVDATLTFTNGSADLDLYLFTSTLSILGESVGVTKTERIQTDAQLPAGTYYLGITAYQGVSPYTLTVTATGSAAPPAGPSNLTATAISSTEIRLTWSDNATNETAYVVEARAGNSGFIQVIDPLPANTNSVTLGGATPGVTFTFRVKARNATGDSSYSNEASATPSGGGTGPTVCTTSSTVACLLNNRFRVSINFINQFANPPAPGAFVGAKLVAGVQNPDVATFGLSSAQAIEAVVRIQDARPFGVNRFDVYYGGLTDLEYTVSVTDTQTGNTKTYRNPPGTVGGGVDRASFPAN